MVAEVDTTKRWRRTERPRRQVAAVASLRALVSAVLLLAGSSTVAVAADNPIAPPPAGSGQYLEAWGLAPTGTDPEQPSSRPALSYELAPGATITDSVTLWNFSDVQLTFHVYATDAYNNRTGQFTLLGGDIKATDVGSWVTLQTNNVTVEPRTRIDIPVTITVPLDAAPGDHTAGIVASVPTPVIEKGQQVVLDRRTGSRVYLRVSGPVNPELVVENVNTDYTGLFNPLDGTLDVSYTVRNPGNVRLGAHPVITVEDLFGRTVATKKLDDITELLPKNAVTFHAKLSGVPALFRLTAKIDLKTFGPRGVNEKNLPPASATSSTWAIPWTLLLALALAFLVFRLYHRWRRQRVVPPRAQSGPGRGGAPGAPRLGPGGGAKPAALPPGPTGRPREKV